jgi:hypothetical protein
MAMKRKTWSCRAAPGEGSSKVNPRAAAAMVGEREREREREREYGGGA